VKNVTQLESPSYATSSSDTSSAHRRTAIVTGASSGIGLGITRALLDRNYRVAANSRNISTAKQLEGSNDLILVDGDIGCPETAAKLVSSAIENFGRLDLLVNNAGIFIPKPFAEYSAEDFRHMVSTNLSGFFYMSQRAIVPMREQNSGHIVTITTSLVDQPIAGVAAALTNLTKGGLQSATKALAGEHAHEGIRVNAIAPGVVDTPMHAPESHEFLKHLHPIQRLARVSEIVDALLYLDNAAFVTGEVLRVDGGAHAGKW
jgi:NAD(P)-dependent dehydrogenase (short-subunit alcohol dehydrogenase family)